MAHPILWHLDMSHYNEKARWALDYKRIPHERRSVFPGAQPLRARMLRGGTSTLPVIDIDGRRIGDSTRIIEELERRWPDPPLYPADPEARRKALEIEDFFDEECAPDVRRVMFDILLETGLFGEASGADKRRGARVLGAVFPVIERGIRSQYKVNPQGVAEARASLTAGLDRIEAELGPSGYLVGDTFTVADLTAAAIFSPFVCPPEFPYHQVDPQRWPDDVREWREQLTKRRAWEWILEMYRRHRGTSAEIGAESAAAA